MKTFYVVRVDGDLFDTYAAETLRAAVEAAYPDARCVVECGKVQAADAGAARLMTPAKWHRVPPMEVRRMLLDSEKSA